MSASSDSIINIEPTSIPEPEPAKVRNSIPCSFCGENVMESRINQSGGKPACIPCIEKQRQLAYHRIIWRVRAEVKDDPPYAQLYRCIIYIHYNWIWNIGKIGQVLNIIILGLSSTYLYFHDFSDIGQLGPQQLKHFVLFWDISKYLKFWKNGGPQHVVPANFFW